MAKVQRAFRYRFCPTSDQAADLTRAFGCGVTDARERHGPVQQETRPAREGIPVL
jgi:hypothetical protein